VTHDSSPGSSDHYGRSSSTRHVILGFRTQDGRDIRVEDTSGIPRVVGDFVQVRYLPERPGNAVAAEAGSSGVSIGLLLTLLFCAVFTCIGLFFAAAGFGIGFYGLSTPTDSSTVYPYPTVAP
jgi:hypothetical protein